MPKIVTAKPKCSVQIKLHQRYFDIMVKEATKLGVSLSELGRDILIEAIKTWEDAKRA